MNLNSSLFGQSTFFGFLVDWFIQTTDGLINFMVLTISVSLYIGMFLYITGMARDMQARIIAIEDDLASEQPQKMNQANKWPIYVREIQFHAEIIR